MTALLLILIAVFFIHLIIENALALRHRRSIKNVVYINGTRGKSSVTRLIDAGLRAGGLKTFCKTTGTLPMTIGVDGIERPLRRHGCANIREQLNILSLASHEGADALIIECMAVDPNLQWVSQHKMLRANIGVITNVRLDHTDLMGETLPEIADALSNTIPLHGILFTAERACFAQLNANSQELGTTAHCILPDADTAVIDFPDNVSLALAVCAELGVPREAAFNSMKLYKRDPYALSLHIIGAGAVFVNGLSINDPQSTLQVYNDLRSNAALRGRRVILLLNNRRDRSRRTVQMAELAAAISPDELWLLGAGTGILRRVLHKRIGTKLPPIQLFKSATAINFSALSKDDLVFAAGNIAAEGKKLMEYIRQEGESYVL